MAGFFSLSSGRGKEEAREQEENNNNSGNTNNNQFLFRNEEIYNKGFEIWPQPQPHQTSFHHQQNLNNFYSFGVGGGGSTSRRNENNLNDDVSVSFSDESTRFGLTVMRSSGSGLSGGGMNCQDCGNQAKKDCPHLRCRTCCKSRGFQCQTHVKSTWVPAAKRRERQHQLSSLQQQNQQQQQFHSSRRHRENPNESSAAGASGSLACTPIPITTTGLELGNFPPELNSPAVFRCVKVSAMDAQDERYAYQTAVNIGGRVFKGILYDQGLEVNYTSANAGGEGSSGGGGGGGEGNQQNLITTTATNVNNPFEYSSLYPAPLNAFMAGTQFFPPPRS
ncbi:protein EXPRESSION OF TERPENOIDS 1-like [Vicia villosa]|uniref:protein EXPRESSION OF TERPENOIDS 1-like n=1 Tax=Vicia villosa TaxID=3911 RepID=UPI00273B781A|nr:protein EXPRESSION OF TERPENOIDS 1-like [Vicia villosa]